MSTPNPPSFPPPPGPPQGPPPGFPPQGPPQGPPAGRGKGLWIALGVLGVLALVAVVVGLVLVLGDGDDDDDARDDRSPSASGAAPDEVVEDLLDAAEKGDCDQAKSFLTASAAAADPCSAPEFRLLSTEEVDAEVGDAEVDGSSATVPVTFATEAGSTDFEFALEQVDGEWRVASYHEGGSDHPTDASEPTESSSLGSDLPTTGAPTPSGSSTADAVANEPTAVVKAFLASAFGGDCATAEELVTPAYLREEGRCDASEIPSDFGTKATYTVGKATVRGTTATVPMKLRYAGNDDSSTVTLTQVGGRWLISDID